MKLLVFDLVDEVYDNGDSLIVKNGGQEDIIPLTNIMKVSCNFETDPLRITLSLKQPSKFGKEIAFMPLSTVPFRVHSLVKDLSERIRCPAKP